MATVTAPAALHPPALDLAAGTCVDSHVPTRRTRDVVRVTMTDHRIARGPVDADTLVAPLEAQSPAVTEIALLPCGDAPVETTAAACGAVAALRAGRSVAAVLRPLEAVVPALPAGDPTAHLDPARGRLATGGFVHAARTARAVLREHPAEHTAHSLLGIALLVEGRTELAIASLERALALQGDPETRFDLALAQLRAGTYPAAEATLDAALEERPTMARARRYKALLARARGDAAGPAAPSSASCRWNRTAWPPSRTSSTCSASPETSTRPGVASPTRTGSWSGSAPAARPPTAGESRFRASNASIEGTGRTAC